MDPLHVQLVAEVSVELPLVVFSVTVLACIARKFRSGAHGFATDFFLFYIVQSLLDLSDYFVYLIYYRLTRDGLLPFFASFPWAFSTSGMVITMLTTSACVYFDIRAFMAFRALSTYRRQTLRHEISLFAFTVLQTAVQFLICATTVCLVVGTFTNNIPLIVRVLTYYPAIYDVYTFSSPVFLFVTRQPILKVNEVTRLAVAISAFFYMQECKTSASAKLSRENRYDFRRFDE